MDVHLGCDMELVKARLANLGRDVANPANIEMRRAAKDSADIVLNEWRTRVPRKSGKFLAGGWAGASVRKGGWVDIKDRGPVYAGVQEFGGTVRWRAKPGPFKRIPIQGVGYRMRKTHGIKVKEPAARIGKDSYYLYPARDEKLPAARDEYMRGVQRICDKYLPSRGNS